MDRSVDIVELGPQEVLAHADGLGRLLLDGHASNIALGMMPPLTLERARAAYLETGRSLRPNEHMLWAALHGDEVVGSVQLVRAAAENARHRAEVVRMAVAASARGQGIGRRLLTAAVERAREMGLGLVTLTTHVGADGDAFYARCGWSRAGEIPRYIVRPDGHLAANTFYYLEL